MFMLRIYLAGPDIFKSDYQVHQSKLKEFCGKFGIILLCPVDDELMNVAGKSLSLRIFEQNIALIDQADIVMANLENFRGFEPDSGTVFEVGYAVGRGKMVWCYNAPLGALVDQVKCDENGRDKDGYLVENFGHGRNLMLMHACHHVSGDAIECVESIKRWIRDSSDVPDFVAP